MSRKGSPSRARPTKAVGAPVRFEGTILRPWHASSPIRPRRLPGRCRAQCAMCKGREDRRIHQSRPSPTTKAAIAAPAKVNNLSPNKCPTGPMAGGQWESPADLTCSSSISFLHSTAFTVVMTWKCFLLLFLHLGVLRLLIRKAKKLRGALDLLLLLDPVSLFSIFLFPTTLCIIITIIHP